MGGRALTSSTLGRAVVAVAVAAAALVASTACGEKKPGKPSGIDAGSSARGAAESRDLVHGDHDHGHPLDAPRARCPIADRLDVNAALDASARLFDEGEFAMALTCADHAARLLPDSVEAHHNRAVALAAVERWDEAKQAFTLALALDPDDPETLAGAAHFYVNRLGPSRESTTIGLEYARRGSSRVGRRRGDRELGSRLALLEAQALDDLGRADEALARVETAIELDPSKVDARFERAMILFHLCRLERARSGFTEILADAPDDADAHHHLGLILELEGRQSDADQHLARARALAPDRFPAPVPVSPQEFRALVDRAVAELDPTNRALLAQVTLELADLPSLADLTAVDPPFPPTILGLYRGAPLGEGRGGAGAAGAAGAAAGELQDEPRAIVLYRKNLARAVATRAELEEQVRITLWHEIGHLRGEDEDDLRERGLE